MVLENMMEYQMKRFQWLVLGLSLAAFAGCGGGVTETKEAVVQIQPEDRLKAMVESAATTGQPMGSGGPEVLEVVALIKAKDPAKGEALQKPAEELAKSSDPAKIKAAAKAILSKL